MAAHAHYGIARLLRPQPAPRQLHRVAIPLPLPAPTRPTHYPARDADASINRRLERSPPPCDEQYRRTGAERCASATARVPDPPRTPGPNPAGTRESAAGRAAHCAARRTRPSQPVQPEQTAARGAATRRIVSRSLTSLTLLFRPAAGSWHAQKPVVCLPPCVRGPAHCMWLEPLTQQVQSYSFTVSFLSSKAPRLTIGHP